MISDFSNCIFTCVNSATNYQSLLDYPIEFLKGIGPQRAESLQKELSIYTYNDLLTHYPFRYVDRTAFQSINEINEDGSYYQLRGQITELETLGEKKAKRLVAKFKDASGIIDLVWFQGHKWMAEKLKANSEYIVYGRASAFNGRFNFPHPDIQIADEIGFANQSAFQPVYHSSEKLKFKGLDSDGIKKAQRILHSFINTQTVPETLTQSIIQDFHFISRSEAIQQIHFPDAPIPLLMTSL